MSESERCMGLRCCWSSVFNACVLEHSFVVQLRWFFCSSPLLSPCGDMPASRCSEAGKR